MTMLCCFQHMVILGQFACHIGRSKESSARAGDCKFIERFESSCDDYTHSSVLSVSRLLASQLLVPDNDSF